MFECDKCKFPCNRRLFFLSCNHSLCAGCTVDIVWDGEDDHFMCCIDPFCKICETSTDIIVETFGGTSRTIVEKRLPDYNKKCDKAKK